MERQEVVKKKRDWTYKKAGVDIESGNLFVKRIKPLVESTRIKGTMGKLGGFAGVFDPLMLKVKRPLLVASTDGVGTKLELALLRHQHDTVGIDLVAMGVNDIITCGAKPIFFLDYFACGRLSLNIAQAVLRGIVKGCREAGCALIGGETAEMPDFYSSTRYDLAGFVVGIVDKEKLITGKYVRVGDKIIGLASSGPHSNGFSLLRKIFSPHQLKGKLGKALFEPTRIYVKPVLSLGEKIKIKGIAHITGGGFYDNIPRAMSSHLGAKIRLGSWPIPKIFTLIKKEGDLDHFEMFRTFNMGVGMAIIVSPQVLKKAQSILHAHGLENWVIGEICSNPGVTIK